MGKQPQAIGGFFSQCYRVAGADRHARAARPLQVALGYGIYSWLLSRIFVLRVTQRPSVLIPWQSLKLQFGSDYGDTPRGLLDFKKQFLLRLKDALLFYPEANVSAPATGLLVAASRLRICHTGGARLSSL